MKIHSKERFLFVMTFEFINFGFIWMGLFKPPNEVSNYFLFVFVGNLMIYFTFYFCMKLVKKEPIPLYAYILILLFFIFAIPGGLLFISKEKTTVVTPALSRNMNQTCVLGIFDKHDLWHFLSAAALFFYFLLLLVIDDGIFDKPRNEIYIF